MRANVNLQELDFTWDLGFQRICKEKKNQVLFKITLKIS